MRLSKESLCMGKGIINIMCEGSIVPWMHSCCTSFLNEIGWLDRRGWNHFDLMLILYRFK